MSNIQCLATALVLLLLSPLAGAYAASDQPARAKSCDRAQFRLILDVGHTAEVPGAMSARGVPEYEFNLRLAKQVKQALLDTGFARTAMLVTAGAARASLMKRVALANRAPADLFVSIHHDSVPSAFKETWEYEGRQNFFSDRFRGHSIFISNDNGDPKASLLFGRLLGNELKGRGLHYAAHYTEPFMGRRQRELVDSDAGVYRYDQLIVLRMTRMPAVLLEAGSIVNRAEELEMTSTERKAQITAAVTEAVTAFCEARARPRPDRVRPDVASRASAPPRPAAAAAAATGR